MTAHGDVRVLRIRRDEKLNALSSHIEDELMRALESDDVAGCRCIVLAGGPRAFSAGADLGELRDMSPEQVMAYYRRGGEMYERLAAMPQPTLAAISGWCLGGGLELALACDFRIAATDATFGLPEVEIGIIPSSGGTLRVVRTLGAARAKELILLRTRVNAVDAAELGLITEAVDGDPLERALEHAARLAELPALAVAVAKQAVECAAESSREAALLIERLAYAMLAQTDDARRASDAFNSRG